MTHPNIIIICSDQHRADTIGSYGATLCRTPSLDRLAAQGIQFNRCFANNPVCSPSRATIVTGRQSRRHGLPRNGCRLPADVPTFPQVLRDHGYATHAVGKLHLIPHSEGVAEAPYYGFEKLENSEDPKLGPYLDWALENHPEYEGYLVGTLFNLPTNEEYWKGKRDFRKEVEACREKYVRPLEISDTCNWGYGHFCPLPEEAHQTSWITDRAIQAVDNRDADHPLLLWVGYQDPHNPFDPPKRFREMYDPDDMPSPVGREMDDSSLPAHTRAFRDAASHFTDRDWRTMKALYYGSVTFMDEAIGRLVDAVESRLDMNNTILVYTSDHGEMLGDRGMLGKSAYHYDSGIRVPMIWRGDGRWNGGQSRDDIVELADFAPTLLDAAGIDAECAMDGISHQSLLEGREHARARDHAYIESFAGASLDPTPPPVCWPRTIRTDRYRCTFYADADAGELYDLVEDPLELTNLYHAPGYEHVVCEHRKRLVSRLILMDHPLP